MEKSDESVEVRGRNVEEAIAKGLAELGLTREEVNIEILSRGSRGLLGLGAEEARVRLTPISRRPAPAEAPKEPAMEKPGVSLRIEKEEQKEPAISASREEAQSIACEVLAGLLKHMGVEAEIVPREPTRAMLEGNAPPPIVLDIRGNDLEVLIGRRGETLGALQYLVRLIVNHRTHRWVNIIVDVQGYRARREQQLQRLAERMAERVVATRRPVTLEAMPPYERRIVHLALRDHPEVTTHSIGEGDSRKVMIHLRQ